MYLIVGLGNPGEQYLGTRHNLGFDVVDKFAKHIKSGSWRMETRFTSEIVEATYNLILARPQTYMNNSGMAVKLLSTTYNLQPTNIVVVHDELDMILGKVKVRQGGSAAGHHGVESIITSLGTDNFVRVRLGIGNKQAFLGEHKRASFDANKFVMEPFLPQEKSKVRSMIKHAILAIETVLEEGIIEAQNQFN